MRFTPIHRELGLPISAPLDWDLMEKVVTAKLPEQRDLDFKMIAYNPRDPQGKKELAKDLCAMANSGGGWIICGIKTDSEKDTALELTPFDIDKNTTPNISTVARTMVQPPLMDMRVHPIESPEKEGKYLVALEVPPSDYFPHLCFLEKANDPLPFLAPVRNGPSTTWLTEPELRRLYQESYNRRERREANAKILFDEYMDYGDIYNGATFVFAAIPISSGRIPPLPQISDHELKSVSLHKYLNNFEGDKLLTFHQSREKGYRSWVFRNEYDDYQHKYFRCEISEDGTLRIAIRLAGWSIPDDYADRYPINEPTHVTQSLVEAALAESLSVLIYLQKKYFSISYQILCSIASVSKIPVIIRQHDLFNKLIAVDPTAAIKHPRIARGYLEAEITEENELQLANQLVRDILNQGNIEQPIYIKS